MLNAPYGCGFVEAHEPLDCVLQADGLPSHGSLTGVWPDWQCVGLDLPRNMFGSSRLAFGRDGLVAGSRLHMSSALRDVKVREGRHGKMGIVRFGYDFTPLAEGEDAPAPGAEPAVVQDLEFLCLPPQPPPTPQQLEERASAVAAAEATQAADPDAAAGAAPPTEPAPGPEPWPTSSLLPDSRMLFRFSSATANSHRIHYDAAWATRVEGYQAVVVHGPLLQLAMLDFARVSSAARPIKSFFFRANAPSWCGGRLTLSGASDPDTATFRVRTHSPTGDTVCEGQGVYWADE